MMKKQFLFLCFWAFCLSKTNAQWAVHLNLNEYYPLFNELKTQYPALWYSSEDDRGVLLGGFGVGVSYRRPIDDSGRRQWWFQWNAQRSRFYDEPVVFTDENGQHLGAFIGVNTHLNTSLNAMQEFLFKKFSLAVGLGLRGAFLSKSNYGEAFVHGIATDLKLKNKSVSPFAAVLPVAVNYEIGKRFGVGLRAEGLLTPASRVMKKERAIVVFGEVSYRF